MSAPYAGGMERYGKRAGLIVHERRAVQRRDRPAALAEGALTATDAFYVRGHGAVPEIDPGAWRLRVARARRARARPFAGHVA